MDNENNPTYKIRNNSWRNEITLSKVQAWKRHLSWGDVLNVEFVAFLS